MYEKRLFTVEPPKGETGPNAFLPEDKMQALENLMSDQCLGPDDDVVERMENFLASLTPDEKIPTLAYIESLQDLRKRAQEKAQLNNQ